MGRMPSKNLNISSYLLPFGGGGACPGQRNVAGLARVSSIVQRIRHNLHNTLTQRTNTTPPNQTNLQAGAVGFQVGRLHHTYLQLSSRPERLQGLRIVQAKLLQLAVKGRKVRPATGSSGH